LSSDDFLCRNGGTSLRRSSREVVEGGRSGKEGRMREKESLNRGGGHPLHKRAKGLWKERFNELTGAREGREVWWKLARRRVFSDFRADGGPALSCDLSVQKGHMSSITGLWVLR